MLLDEGIIRVGMEIEIAAFADGVTYQDVIRQLLEAGYMDGGPEHWEQWHQYKCKCTYGCARVASGDVLVPHRVAVQYDASLPESGAEFIVSPTLMNEGLSEVRPVWDIITHDAEWRNDIPAMRGMASPSIHLHVSVSKQTDGIQPEVVGMREDALHALSLFGPEMIGIVDEFPLRRGLAFRQPWRHADGRNNHHGFLQIRKMLANSYAYVEWRMFEAEYDNFEYIETGAYLAAALTRALMHPQQLLPNLFRDGYTDPVDQNVLRHVIQNDDTDGLLRIVSPVRLELLRNILVDELQDDAYGTELIERRFEEVMRRV